MRIALLAPTASSLYARALMKLLGETNEIELVGVLVRRIFSWPRFRAELRRDGPRLLGKIRQKLVLKEAAYPADGSNTMRSLVRELDLSGGSLREDARRQGVPFATTPDHNHPRAERFLRGVHPELIVFSGGGLIRRPILELAPLGVLNCHSGILPRYRGMDVVEWALLEDANSGNVGLTTHIMDPGVDTGPILLQHVERVLPGDSIENIRRRLEPRMVTLMIETVQGIQMGTINPRPQLPQDGRQHFVMHPRLKNLAQKAIGDVYPI